MRTPYARFSSIARKSGSAPQEVIAYPWPVESIHTRIKARRAALNLTQQQLAERVGVTYQTVQQWETEPDPSNPKVLSTAPKRTRLAQVAAALGVTEEWLVTGRDGDGRPHDPIANQLVGIYAQLPEHLQEALMQTANALLVAADPTKRSAANPYPGKAPPGKIKKH
jgi:transcriptional regulator with XRE-family HTH domain